MEFRTELIDELIKDYQKPEDILGENGILKKLTQAIIERTLAAELTTHLGYEKHAPEGRNSGDSRNGTTEKTLIGDSGTMTVEVPRDRDGDFEPQIVRKRQRRIPGFEDKILSMYARGMTTRDIQAHVRELYQVSVSPELISQVTAEVMDEVREWQNRQIEAVYPIIYFDAIRIKIRDEGHVVNKSAYLAIGVRPDGFKDVLGIWLEREEGAKFWLKVITELQNRGLKDVLIACVDGLKGLPEAIESVFPQTQVQVCIVHMVRNSMRFVSYKDRRKVVADLKLVYRAPTEESALTALAEFEERWESKYPLIGKSWRSNWARLSPFYAYPPEIRKAIYTTNAIESLNNALRKVTKNRGAFPNDESAAKLLYMAIRNIMKKWTMPIQNWPMAANQLSIIFKDRMPEK
jgi:putative transposase